MGFLWIYLMASFSYNDIRFLVQKITSRREHNYITLIFRSLDSWYSQYSLRFGFLASSREIPEQIEDTSIATAKLPPPEKMTPERVYGKNGSMRKTKVPITATPYTVASLQVATNSFCQDSLLGEGSLGRVYKADFPNGKVQCASSKIKIYIFGVFYCNPSC
jgi:hypothetical protein